MTERVLVGYDECRCILTQYCDGECRPVFADRAVRSTARATPADHSSDRLDMSLEARLADAEADVLRLHAEKMDLWFQVHGFASAGWKLAPMVLTENMRIAVKAWVQRHPIPGAGLYAQELWNDILSAAPQAPQPEAQSVRDAQRVPRVETQDYFVRLVERYGMAMWESRNDEAVRLKIELCTRYGDMARHAALKSAPLQKPVSDGVTP